LKLWDTLSPLSKVTLARLYKEKTGLDFVWLEEEDGRKIHFEGKLEDLSEIEKLMKENQGVWHE
jgi:hypothetical protein